MNTSVVIIYILLPFATYTMGSLGSGTHPLKGLLFPLLLARFLSSTSFNILQQESGGKNRK